MDGAQLPLPRWEVDLIGEERDLAYLVAHFASACPRVYRDVRSEQVLMLVEGFPHDAAADEVLAAAVECAKALAGVMKVMRQSLKPLAVGGVMHRRADGTRHVYAAIHETAGASVEFHGKVLRRDGSGQMVPVPQGPPPAVLLAGLARTDPIVAKAMRLAVAPDAETWTGLFRLYELIEGAEGGPRAMTGKGWISSNQRERFRRTANSSASGDASRHGHENSEPPPNPMTAEEARAFVQMVVQAWIADRLAQAATACNNPGNP